MSRRADDAHGWRVVPPTDRPRRNSARGTARRLYLAAPQRMVSGAGLVQDSVHAPRHVPRIARLGGARKPSVCRRLKRDGADKTIKGGRADRGSTGVGGCGPRPAVILRPSMRGPGGPAIEDHAADLAFQDIHDWGNVGIGVLRAGEDGRDK